MNDITIRGITALKAGDRASARKFLAAAIQQDPNDASSWLWLAAAVDTIPQRRDCLRQVLKIDPQNQAALKGLAALQSTRPETPAASPDLASAHLPTTASVSAPSAEREEAALVQADAPGPEPVITATETATVASEQPLEAEQQVSETRQPAAEIAQPASAPGSLFPAAVPAGPVEGYRPPVRNAVDEANATKIFNIRPSNVPALLCFWLFFFGAVFIGSRISALNPGGTFETEGFLGGMPFAMFGLLVSLGIAFLLEMVVLYVIIRNLRTHYVLTSAALTVPFRGRKTSIPLRDITGIACRQSFWQRLYGAGDLLVNAAVRGELTRVRLRAIPNCNQRAKELGFLIEDRPT